VLVAVDTLVVGDQVAARVEDEAPFVGLDTKGVVGGVLVDDVGTGPVDQRPSEALMLGQDLLPPVRAPVQ
jgi:hypothetical protein